MATQKRRWPSILAMIACTPLTFNLYRMVVLPAASRPTIKIRISCLENNLANTLQYARGEPNVH